ncbi:unnamed protein product [Cyprideis torosa]|uniref:Uncharacterized protein n=1 Tax=Cyprideis torosa TaxID=163714 RepID=A0A7R8WGC3_9CRUS|nr:unnamed protein product [Cyprideis torosa]CAG0891598.1 unnamed protein product [Cyprideis torosa]
MAAATTEEVLVSELSQLDITTTTSSSSPPRSSPLPRDSTPALSSRTSTPSSNKRFGSFSPLHPPISPIVELHSRELARKLQRRLEQLRRT